MSDISFVSGGTARISITPRKSDLTLIPLSGATLEWWMVSTFNKRKILEKTLDDGITVQGDSVIIDLLPEDTYSLHGRFYH